ncbi:MAG: OsmC family protein [Nitrososphaerota archaeon]
MMINNIDLAILNETRKKVESGALDKIIRMELVLDWTNARNLPPISAFIKSERSALMLESDLPTYLGGKGASLSPMQYFLYGLASTFLSTLMIALSERSITVSKARAILSADVDVSGLLGIPDKEKVKNTMSITLNLELECDIEEKELPELIDLAKARCPVFWEMSLNINLKKT